MTTQIDLTIWIGLTIPSGRFDLIGWIDFTWKFTIRIGLVIPMDYLSKRIDLTSRITLDIRVQARITLNIRIQVLMCVPGSVLGVPFDRFNHSDLLDQLIPFDRSDHFDHLDRFDQLY